MGQDGHVSLGQLLLGLMNGRCWAHLLDRTSNSCWDIVSQGTGEPVRVNNVTELVDDRSHLVGVVEHLLLLLLLLLLVVGLVGKVHLEMVVGLLLLEMLLLLLRLLLELLLLLRLLLEVLLLMRLLPEVLVLL